MAIKKSELYASLWKSCDELRGGMDASQYKDYVLVLLFMKYVSDKAASRPDYDLIVPAGGSFADMVALKGKADIGDGINKVIAKLAGANDSLRGAIDVADFNDDDKLGKARDKVDRLTNLVAIFESPALDFRGNSAQGDDLLGDAYEYLMRNFATESGKSKGQFYTPAEVSRIMSAVVGVAKATSRDQSIYDPTCGSGSLLLKAHDAAQAATGLDLAIYGQEMDNATAALARMNMVLHDATTAEIWQDNTLAAPHWRDERSGGLKSFDYVVANPPFSTKSWTNGFDPVHDPFDRFRYGMPPPKNGDYAFLLHMLASLKSTGRAAVILPHGVLFRGNQEAVIRRNLVRHGFIEGIIGLPANLFYGTGIPACIIVLDKGGAGTRGGIFLLDASRGFIKDGNKNRLRERDIHRMVDAFVSRREEDRYSRFVPMAEIEANDFNLNIARYLDSSDPEDVQDIDGHLRGGIPNRDLDALSPYWDVFPAAREALVGPALRPGYSVLCVKPDEVADAVYSHDEFAAFNRGVTSIFDGWCQENRGRLRGLQVGDHPKALVADLSDGLRTALSRAPLMDPYAVFQRLMDYWSAVLQDDAYLVTTAGWEEAARLRLVSDGNGAKDASANVLTIGKQRFRSDLVPASLVVRRYFRDEQAAIASLEAEIEDLTSQMADLAEEHGGEGGLLEEVVGDGGRISKPAIVARLKAIGNDEELADERSQIIAYGELLNALADAKAMQKQVATDLTASVVAQYGALSVEDIKTLVVEDKWLAYLRAGLEDEIHRVSRLLATRLTVLATRYASPVPEIMAEVADRWGQVSDHLHRMGATWR